MESSDTFRRYARDAYTMPHGQNERSSADGVAAESAGSLRRMDELVGGTLASQALTSRVKTLAERADGFDEKILNLTRLVQLAQGLAAEREEELRRENDELRTRVKRQEQVTARLQQELEAFKSGLEQQVMHLVRPCLDKQMSAQEAAVAGLQSEIGKLRTALDAASQEQARQSQAASQCVAEIDATREWVKRNLQRLKQHVDAAQEAVAEVERHQEGLTGGLRRVECKAEVEYKKLRLLLQKRTKESEALMALLERELVEVHKVAKAHRVLQSSDIDLRISDEGDE